MPLRRWSVSQHGHTVLNICKNLFKAILAILKILVWAGSVKWPLQAGCVCMCFFYATYSIFAVCAIYSGVGNGL